MSNRSSSTIDALVPPASLAALLVQSRGKSHRSLESIEFASEGRFPLHMLVQIEAGVLTLNDKDLREIAQLYGVSLSELTPSRSTLFIDRNEGKIFMGDTKGKFMPDDNDEKILLRYLALVYKMRDTKPGIEVGPRDNDLFVLSTVFGCSPEEIRQQLQQLMKHSASEIRVLHGSLRSRVIVPALGILVALTAVGGLILARSSDDPSAAPASAINIGTALIIERDAAPSIGASSATAIDQAIIIDSQQ
jgi:hypothetical protein